MTRDKANEDKEIKKPTKKTPEACKPKSKHAKGDKPPPPHPSSSPNTKAPQGNTQGSRAKASKALAHTYTSDSQRNKTATYTRRMISYKSVFARRTCKLDY